MRSLLGAVAVASSLLFATPAHAAWQAAGLQGSNVLSLVEDPTTASTWFAGTSAGEVHRYTSATGWVGVSVAPGFGVVALSVARTNPAVVYAAVDGSGVFKSADGGGTWLRAGLEGLSVRSVEVDPYDAAIVYAAANGQIQKSADGGSTWQAITSTELAAANVQELALPPADPALVPAPVRTDTIYAAALGGLYRSTDAGSTWVLLDTASSGVSTSDFTTAAVDPSAPTRVYVGTAGAGLYRSTDGGNTWSASDGLGTGDVLSIAFY